MRLVVLTRSFCYPHGYASAGRARLVAQALTLAGAEVRVLCMRAVDRPPGAGNTAVRGEHQGVRFEHTCGRTIRAQGFLGRRWSEARGVLVAAARLIAWKRSQQVDVVYFWWGHLHWRLAPWLYVRFLRLLGLPVVLELNELPWSLLPQRTPADRLASPLAGFDGVLAISTVLERWAVEDARRSGRRLAVATVPILVDTREEPVEKSGDKPAARAPYVLLAASMAYKPAVRFALMAMQQVWQEVADCELVLPGAESGDPAADWLLDERRAARLDARVRLMPFLTREDLLAQYRGAVALLCPLFDEPLSRARFPTKLGEYLASGRPVVVNAVGPVADVLTDRVDAYVCAVGDPRAYAGAIVTAHLDPEEAERIGRAGRERAEQVFDYRRHAETLRELFADVTVSRTGK